jgi:GNAT superfamily N-acetyltransferase
MFTYTVAHDWDDSAQVVMDGLTAFNKPVIGPPNERKLSVISRNDKNEVIAGLLAAVNLGWMYVAWIWVAEPQRRKGIGKELMAKAETEARTLDCHHVWLTTRDFQARPFYESISYKVFAALEDYPKGHTRFFMRKCLAPSAGDRG